MPAQRTGPRRGVSAAHARPSKKPDTGAAVAEGVPIRDVSGNRIIARIKDRVFEKQGFKSSVHIFRTFNAIGVDVYAYDLHREFFDYVEARCTETGAVYRISRSTFDKSHKDPKNFGHGEQYLVPISYWSVDGQPPAQEVKPPKPPPDAVQLDLF